MNKTVKEHFDAMEEQVDLFVNYLDYLIGNKDILIK